MSALEVMAATDARRITDQIKTGVEAVWELIKQAYVQQAWVSLGYSSWDDYCTREFGTARLRLPREDRPEVVSSLRDSGLSIRAIAAATGDSRDTVHRALNSGVRNRTPETEIDADALAEELIAAEPVLGRDGKTYHPQPKKRPSEPRRRPLAESARELAMDLKNITARMETLLADDRFARNKDEVAAQIRHHLGRAIEVCQQFDSQINNS